MRPLVSKRLRAAIAISPGALVCAVIFFAQIFERDDSLKLTTLVADKATMATIQEAQSLPAHEWHSRPVFPMSFPSSTLIHRWLRVDLPATTSERRLVAETRFPYFTEIEFFVVKDNQVTQHWRTGIGHPESFSDHPGLYFHYPFTASGGTTSLYVRTAGLGSAIAKVSVYDADTFLATSRLRDRVMGALFGCSLMIIFLNIAMFFTMRSPDFLFEIGTQTALLFVVYFLEGYYKRLTPNVDWDFTLWIKWSIAFYLVGLCFMMEFYRRTLNLDQNFPGLRHGYRYIYFLCVVGIVVTLSSPFTVGFAAALVASWVSWTWLINRHIRYVNLKSIFITFLGQSGGISAIIATTLTIFDLISDSLINKSMAHIGIIWIGASNFIMFGMRLMLMEERSRKIKMALTSSHYRTELNRLLTSSYEQTENTNKVEVTIMFVDIVSFSLLSADRSASDIFQSLSSRLSEIVKAIEKEGGSVDRSLGDGVLCYFAANNIGSEKKHALAAFDAACAIQEDTVRSSTSDADLLIMPVRIGIHSAEVMIGNLGDEHHLDFTMIGSGVNFASRLETAASPFKINLSQATVKILQQHGLKESLFQPINISMKHHTSLIKAFEFDPFRAAPERMQRAETKFFDQLGLKRTDQRHVIATSSYLRLQFGDNSLSVEDFSRHGFRAVGESMYGRRSTFTVQIETSSGIANKALSEKFLRKIVVEVRWSRQEEGRFVHGLKIVGGSAIQCNFLFELFRDHLATASLDSETGGAIDSSLVA